MNLNEKRYFIAGIDTDAGKTYATGHIAAELMRQGRRVLTHKPIQTGCTNLADDILTHRRIMGIDLTEADRQGQTMPQIFPHPCSPHLAARLAEREIDFAAIDASLDACQAQCDILLIEGAGGLLVPLTENLLQIDWIAQHQLPIILVSSAKLGSINHTLMSLEAIAQRGLTLAALAYNHHFNPQDPIIAADTAHYLQNHLAQHQPHCQWLNIPSLVMA